MSADSHSRGPLDREMPAIDRDRLNEMVAEADTGGRNPGPGVTRLIAGLSMAWALFQLWYASPLPYALNWGVISDSIARPVHLAFALMLAFLTFPAFKSSPRNRVPVADWVLGLAGVACALYLVAFYRQIVQRPGLPTTADIVVAVAGVLILLEAARRAVGPAITIIAAVMLGYIFAGPYLPGLIAHKGASLSRAASQMWLTPEGVFGVALGVSTNVVFMFVLFGTLLERAGAGAYFIQLAFSLLGRFRGGPAKAGVVASGLTGMISGSSIANVVTTGTFTIPLMRKVGYTPVKAGAIECAAGVNGQIMPPVMGAAAFLMAEYVGVPYSEIVRSAFLPAILVYGSLFYIVDIEAQKMGLRGLPARLGQSGLVQGLMGICGFVILCAAVFWGIGWMRPVFGDAARWIIIAAMVALYLGLLWHRARHPDLALDDPDAAITEIPLFNETARTGLHFLIPVVLLIWCLMVEEMSPGLSAFWGSLALMILIVTQRPLTAVFRRLPRVAAEARAGVTDLVEGLSAGARNMVTVGIATATAGIIVGTVLLTGVGLVMTEIVEFVSGGSFLIMLLLTAIICLILGMGMPTTASYVVVATLMAPVMVSLAAQNDLAVPLIAVHMFVFYFGLMADVTPPVGLAAYAAAAISGADPVKTGYQAFAYEIRTALLPFVFIFNTGLLLIDIAGPLQLGWVIVTAVAAMAAFVAATQGWFLVRNRRWETAALLLICFALFRPGWIMDRFAPESVSQPANALLQLAEAAPAGGSLQVRFNGIDMSGADVSKLVRLPLGEPGTGPDRLQRLGLTLNALGDTSSVGLVTMGGTADRLGLEQGDEVAEVLVPSGRPSKYWPTVPAIGLMALIGWLQLRRKRAAVIV